MTTVDATVIPSAQPSAIRARPAGFVARHELDRRPRAPQHPARAGVRAARPVIPLFFFFVNVGALTSLTENAAPGFDYKAFMLPARIIFGVTGISRAPACSSPTSKTATSTGCCSPRCGGWRCCSGMMVADIVLVGRAHAAGDPGRPAGGRELRDRGARPGRRARAERALGPRVHRLPVRHRAQDRQPRRGATRSFLLFFPFAFLTTSFVPRAALSGWMDTAAGWNPVTYVLAGMRSLISDGWDWTVLGQALLAIGIMGAVSMSLCFASAARSGEARLNQSSQPGRTRPDW